MNDATETATILFTLADEREGQAVAPGNISLAAFNRFNREVEDFLKGGLPKSEARALLQAARPRVRAGSYGLEVALPADALAGALQADLTRMQHPDGLRAMDAKRAAVVQKWQREASRSRCCYAIRIASSTRHGCEVRIDSATDYCAANVEAWLPVEKYLRGEVIDIGGVKPNLHLRCKPGEPAVKIAADVETLRDDERNRIYRRVMMRVAAEQSYPGGALRNIRLLEILDPPAMPSEEEFAADVKEATALWRDVADPARWVAELRGHSE